MNLADILRARMQELDIDLAELVQRYCKVRTDRGEVGVIPNNQRKTIVRILERQGSPTVETLVDLIAALEGEVSIHWRTERQVLRVEVEERADTLNNDS